MDDIEELVQMCHMLSVLPMIPENTGLSAMCLSGGETGVCADTGTLLGLQYPDLAPETMDKLKALLPDYATPANPLDMSATLAHDGEKYAAVIQAIMEDPSIGMVLCGRTILPNTVEGCDLAHVRRYGDRSGQEEKARGGHELLQFLQR